MMGLLTARRFSNFSYAVRRVSGFSAYLNYSTINDVVEQVPQ